MCGAVAWSEAPPSYPTASGRYQAVCCLNHARLPLADRLPTHSPIPTCRFPFPWFAWFGWLPCSFLPMHPPPHPPTLPACPTIPLPVPPPSLPTSQGAVSARGTGDAGDGVLHGGTATGGGGGHMGWGLNEAEQSCFRTWYG